MSQQLGMKEDSGKPILGAIPPHAELAVGRVLTFGAGKYERGNWEHVSDHENRYMDAALRHLNAHRRGEKVDGESGESHLAHASCCILFLLDKQERIGGALHHLRRGLDEIAEGQVVLEEENTQGNAS